MDELDLLKVCRTCMGTANLSTVDSIQNMHQLLKNFLDLLPLPRQEAICSTCARVVLDFQEFCYKSQAVDRDLRERIHVNIPKLESLIKEEEVLGEVSFYGQNEASADPDNSIEQQDNETRNENDNRSMQSSSDDENSGSRVENILINKEATENQTQIEAEVTVPQVDCQNVNRETQKESKQR